MRFYSLLFFFVLVGCEHNPAHHFGILIHNNSHQDIWVNGQRSEEGSFVPDTINYSERWDDLHKIEKGNSSMSPLTFSHRKLDYEYIFQKSSFFSVFIRTCSTFTHEHWYPEDGYELARYDLTMNELITLNWEISYPPDERMKFIRMWPPFDSYQSHPTISESYHENVVFFSVICNNVHDGSQCSGTCATVCNLHLR